jgi:predicted NUDIX family phosphoesterase/dephospho-CoA kinase
MSSEFLIVAERVLLAKGNAMSASQIVDYATAHQLFSDRVAGKTPFQTMKSKLSVDIRTNGSNSKFMRTAPGKFFLRAALPTGIVEYEAPKYLKTPPSERVLTVPSAEFYKHVHFQGISLSHARVQKLLNPSVCRYLDRLEAELSNDSKQVLTYIMVSRGTGVLCFQRGNFNRVEDFLRGSNCIGFGGHVSETDNSLLSEGSMGLFESARRELMEELRLPRIDQTRLLEGRGLSLVGVLNDDSSPVGRRHFAFIFRYKVSRDTFWDKPIKGEKSIAQLHWIRPNKGHQPIWKFEYWSQLCLRQFLPLLAKTASAYQIVRSGRVSRASIICVIGALGSGKSEATRVLAHAFGYSEINSGRVLARLLGVRPVTHRQREEFQKQAFHFIQGSNGPKTLAATIASEILRRKEHRFVVDGLRQRKTYEELCTILGKERVAVIYVHTLPDIAFKFYVGRSRSLISFSEFLKLRDAEVERDVPGFLKIADAVIYNWEGKSVYLRTVRHMFEAILFPSQLDKR